MAGSEQTGYYGDMGRPGARAGGTARRALRRQAPPRRGYAGKHPLPGVPGGDGFGRHFVTDLGTPRLIVVSRNPTPNPCEDAPRTAPKPLQAPQGQSRYPRAIPGQAGPQAPKLSC